MRVFIGTICAMAVSFACGMAVMDYIYQENQPRPNPLLNRRPPNQPYFLPLEFANDVIYYADEQDIPVWMACRLFDKESWFNPHPRPSRAGAIGMGQFMPANLEMFSKRYNEGVPIDINDHHTVIKVTIRYLGDLYHQFGDYRRAVGAYNAGPYVIPHYWKQETVDYVHFIVDGRVK